MAFFEFKDVRIAGISAAVPRKTFDNTQLTESDGLSKDYTPQAFIETTGVKERRVSGTLTTSDLCYAAAERLIVDLKWDKADIEAIVFVSQTPDYILPATACILQERLGLSKECYAEDISLGCSGWVYGLSTVLALLSQGTVRKALLLVGDAKRRIQGGGKDPLFGSAGTATAVEHFDGGSSYKFHFGTDGSGYDAIITPDGGSRNPVSMDSFKEEIFEGKTMCRLQTRMKGMDVFGFGITTVPKTVRSLSEKFSFDYLEYDYYIFHQANMKMINMIAQKLKLSKEKVPMSMPRFGNTSSASIPLTIVTELKDKQHDAAKYICCGFGVGLSWGTVAFETEGWTISELVEVDEQTDKSIWV